MRFNVFGRGRPLQWAISFTCMLTFTLFGYDQGVFGGIVGNADWNQTFGYPGSGLEGIIVSIYNLGAFSGTIIQFFLAERLGRRKSLWFGLIWIIVGAVLQASSYSVAQLMVARYITGIGTGIETSTTPMYQSELCEARKRGRLVSAEPMFVGVGIVIAYFFDYGMSFVGGPIAWRLPIAMQIVFALIAGAMVFTVPESPRYLYKEGRNQEAMEVLCQVYDGEPDSPVIVREQKDILDALALEKMHGEYRWSQLLKRDEVQTGYRVLLAYGMQFMNQMGGINLVVYYVPSALEDNVGLSKNLALVIGGCVQTMFFFGSLIPSFFLDRLGRRKPMMIGSFGCGFSMMMIAILLSFNGNNSYSAEVQHNTSSASVAFFFTYMLIFGATANCIPWVYVPEILPLHVRAKGMAVGISANWLWNFVVVMITPSALDNLKWKAYLIFMVLNMSFIPLIYYVYPETRNLGLEEIDELFVKGEEEYPETKVSGFKKLLVPTEPVRISMRLKRRGIKQVEEVDSQFEESKIMEERIETQRSAST